MSPFWTKNMTFEVPIGIVFSFFFSNDLKSRKVFVFQYFSTIWDQRKTIGFPIAFLLFFHVFSKPLPGTVFRGSQCRTFIKSLFWVSFSIWGIFKKNNYGAIFGNKGSESQVPLPRVSVLEPTLLFTKP